MKCGCGCGCRCAAGKVAQEQRPVCQQSSWFILGGSLGLEVGVSCQQERTVPFILHRSCMVQAVILAGLRAEGWRCPIPLEYDLKTISLALSAY